LREHDFDGFRRYQAPREHGGAFRFPPGQARVPLMYSLRATRPG